jgi:hypothetical protein
MLKGLQNARPSCQYLINIVCPRWRHRSQHCNIGLIEFTWKTHQRQIIVGATMYFNSLWWNACLCTVHAYGVYNWWLRGLACTYIGQKCCMGGRGWRIALMYYLSFKYICNVGGNRSPRRKPTLSEEWVWPGIKPTTSEVTGADVNFEHRSYHSGATLTAPPPLSYGEESQHAYELNNLIDLK